MNFQSISDLNSAIASLADWGQKISFEFFEIKLKKFRKSIKHKGLVSNSCSKSAPRQGLSAALGLRSLIWNENAWFQKFHHRPGFFSRLQNGSKASKKWVGALMHGWLAEKLDPLFRLRIRKTDHFLDTFWAKNEANFGAKKS